MRTNKLQTLAYQQLMDWDKWRVEKGLDSLQLPPTGKALIALRRYENVPDQNPQPTLDDHKRVRKVVVMSPIFC